MVGFRSEFGLSQKLLLVVLAVCPACTEKKEEALPAGEIQAALASSQVDLPVDLSGTKLFEAGDPLRPRFGVIAYNVKVPLWSDGAIKSRYIFVPPAARISFDDVTQSFVFPVGTVFIKHFASSTNSYAPIETRMIVLKSDNTWRFLTYVWKEGGISEASTKPVTVAGADGLDYRIPSEKECRACHVVEGSANAVLGFKPEQLNFGGANNASGIAFTQFDELMAADLFDEAAVQAGGVKALPDLADESVAIDVRTRAYLDVNCSSCHRPGGSCKEESFDLRFTSSESVAELIALGKVIAGNPQESILWEKFSAATERMPPLSIRHDPQGMSLLPQWIERLK